MTRRASAIFAMLMVIWLAGCGSDVHQPTATSSTSSSTTAQSGVAVASPAAPTPSPSATAVPVPPGTPTGTIVVDTTQASKVPLVYNAIQFYGKDETGKVVYGPLTQAKAAAITLTGVPVTVVHLTMLFLQDSVLVGSWETAVVVLQDGTATVTVPQTHVIPKVPSLIVESTEGVQPIVDFIDGAKKTLDVATTALSQADVLAALQRAVSRGVTVRVLFGGQAPSTTLAALQAAHIATVVKAACGEEAIIVDARKALVMTLDLSDAPFGVQRDLAVQVTDTSQVTDIVNGFNADFSGTTFTPTVPGLFWSPNNARAQLVAMISSAQSTLDIETTQLTDQSVMTALMGALQRGVRLRIVMSGTSTDASANNRAILTTLGADVQLVNSPTLNIDDNLVVADLKRAFVGSQSLSATALDVNRNLGVSVTDATMVETLDLVFENDLALAKQVGPIDPHKTKIKHIVIVFNENNSFDHLYGTYPGARGVADNKTLQVNSSGVPYTTLPPLAGSTYPTSAPNQPFQIDPLYYMLKDSLPTPVHRFYPNLMQVNGTGYAPNLYNNFRMNAFVAVQGDCGPMGYWDTTTIPMYPIARQNTLCDNFFTGTFGGSMFGAIFLVAAQPMYWPNAPTAQVLQPVFNGFNLVGLNNPNGTVTPDGYVVEDINPIYGADPKVVLNPGGPPVQTFDTVGERLSKANVSWAWYSEGWNQAVQGHPPNGFTDYHIPFLYFQPYQPGQPQRAHLQDLTDFQAALKNGTLPAVSYIKATDENDEHSGSSTQLAGELFAAGVINDVQNSSAWDSTVIIMTYDDFGGFTDHVAPVMEDRWGPGDRLPCVIVSPFAKVDFVDSTLYNQSSILKFIEWRFGLQPLTARDTNATNFVPNAFNLEKLVK